jgi:hypothetical protein
VAGPWFTVQKSGGDWKQLDEIWLNIDGKNIKARVECKMQFNDPTIPHEVRK